MVYVPETLLLEAAKSLNGAHPLTVVTIPALLRKARQMGVDLTKLGLPFGSKEEVKFLEDFYRLPNPPDDKKPFRAIWSKDSQWSDPLYPGRSLQRQREKRNTGGKVFIQEKGSPQDLWRLTKTAGADLISENTTPTKTNPNPKMHIPPVQLVDLAIWLGRSVDTDKIDGKILASANLSKASSDLDKLVAWLMHEIGPHQADLIDTVYSTAIPARYRTEHFNHNVVPDEFYRNFGSMARFEAEKMQLGNLVENIEHRMESAGYQLPENLVRRVISAWMRGDIVILTGQPGTGKTLFATLLADALKKELDLQEPLMIPVRSDFDEAEFIGYERLDGNIHLSDFARQVLLNGESTSEVQIAILEEFNLAVVEKYLSSILTAMQARSRTVRLPDGTAANLPIDTFIIATCNSFRDEPETRTRVSAPTKRRATTITMPNLLGERYERDPSEAVLSSIGPIIEAERRLVQDRIDNNKASTFDTLRIGSLDQITDLQSFSIEALNSLVSIANSILETTTGRSWFTFGLLKDVVMSLVMSERNPEAEMSALGFAVADKIIHQLRGIELNAQPLLEATASLPNSKEIERLVAQSKFGGTDELLPLL